MATRPGKSCCRAAKFSLIDSTEQTEEHLMLLQVVALSWVFQTFQNAIAMLTQNRK